MNEHGLCVGTTNLRTWDARAGVPYLSILHRALRARRVGDAVEEVHRAHRAGAHSYVLCDAEGAASVVECSAGRSFELPVTRGTDALTNHCRVPENAAIEADTPRASSMARKARMEALLEQAGERIDAPGLERLLADDEGGELAICRQDFDGISTNAAVVMAPGESLRACAGPPSRGSFEELFAA